MKRSVLIIPLYVLAQLLIINFVLFAISPLMYSNFNLVVSINLIWIFIALMLNFYTIERKERFITKYNKFLRHYLSFALGYFTILAFQKVDFNPQYQINVLFALLLALSVFRWVFFKVRKIYRIEGGNSVKVVVIGKDDNLERIKKVFKELDFGYRYLGYFHNDATKDDKECLGSLEDCYNYIINENVDEVYCMVSQLNETELNQLIHLADNNLIKLNLVPDNKGIATMAMNVELFGTLPIVNLRNLPLEQNYAKYGKRGFDIIFSLLVIVFILSWLVPLIFLINKLDSDGPIFFKQPRNGINKKLFWCYKFRSMKVNLEANDRMCTKGDIRITKIGNILRKTSIDELPQFINVLLGDMSVVGPRPHMEKHTGEYEKDVDKYLVRHFVKPGITGLAQVKGFRGEILKKVDIINRTKFDIVYLENWSVIMDIKIIFSTIFNCFKGDNKAY